MSETPTVAEQAAAPPPPDGSPSDRAAPRPAAAGLPAHPPERRGHRRRARHRPGRRRAAHPAAGRGPAVRLRDADQGGALRAGRADPHPAEDRAAGAHRPRGRHPAAGRACSTSVARASSSSAPCSAPWIAYAAGGFGILGAVLGMLAGIAAGAFIGFIAGVLKATRGVHEVITTIMLNYIAAGVTWWLVTGPLQAESSKTSGIPQTELIPESAQVGAVAEDPDRVRHRGPARRRLLVDAVAQHAGLPVQHGRREQARGRLRRHQHQPDRHAVDGPGRWPGRPGRRARGARAPCTGSNRPSAARSASTASPSRCSPGPTRWRRSPRPSSSASCAPGPPGLQFETGIAPEVVDVLLAIILLMVSIPVLGKWIFRSRADKVSAASTSWGN